MSDVDAGMTEPGPSNDSGGSEVAQPMVPDDAGSRVESAQDAYEQAPRSWKPEIAERHWRNLPPDLRQYVSKRETEAHKAITDAGQDRKRFDALQGTFDKFKDVFEANKLEPHDAVERLFAIERWLRTEPENAVKELATAYNVPLPRDTIAPVLDNWRERIPALQQMEPMEAVERMFAATHFIESNPVEGLRHLAQAYGIDPQQLIPEQQRNYVSQLEAQLTEKTHVELQKAVDKFKEGKEEYYEELRPEFIKELQAVRTKAPGLDATEVLKLAWERLTTRTGFAEKISAKAKEKEEGERLKELAKHSRDAKKAAGINAKSSTANTASPKTMDDDLREMARKHYPNYRG